MIGKTTRVAFDGKQTTETDPLYQYDYGQELEFTDIELPANFEAHFSNSVRGKAKIVVGENNLVTIPDEYLLTGDSVMCWVYLHEGENDGETEYVVHIPVRPRPAISIDDIIEVEPNPVSTIMTILTRIDTSLGSIEESLNSIDERLIVVEQRIPGLGGWAHDIEEPTGGEPDDQSGESDPEV